MVSPQLPGYTICTRLPEREVCTFLLQQFASKILGETLIHFYDRPYHKLILSVANNVPLSLINYREFFAIISVLEDSGFLLGSVKNNFKMIR